ncbi:hypothetical protein ABIB75_000875 [Bradyrhizobium sp. GM2.2]|uniref:hypothetical protein n=1 Tax=Bradyrhizobium sp. GM2.2 TaxID=3156358 RepID=UPI003394AFA1
MTFERLTEEQWKALHAICDDWPDGVDWLRFRQRIDAAGKRYADGPAVIASAGYGPPHETRKDINETLELTRRLKDRLGRLSPKIQELLPDPGLRSIEEILEAAFAMNEALVAVMPSGNWNQFRNQLTSALITIWDEEIADVAFSKTRVENKPYGPLIDFLNLTLLAITGKAPGPSGAAQSIEAYRKFGYVPLLNQKFGP